MWLLRGTVSYAPQLEQRNKVGSRCVSHDQGGCSLIQRPVESSWLGMQLRSGAGVSSRAGVLHVPRGVRGQQCCRSSAHVLTRKSADVLSQKSWEDPLDSSTHERGKAQHSFVVLSAHLYNLRAARKRRKARQRMSERCFRSTERKGEMVGMPPRTYGKGELPRVQLWNLLFRMKGSSEDKEGGKRDRS